MQPLTREQAAWVVLYETQERKDSDEMGRYAKEGGSFTPCPAGLHVARCIKLIDLGTQHGEYEGKPNIRQQVVVQWEVPGETIDTDDGPQPMIVSKFYTNSLGERANLRTDLESWRGRAFSPEELGGFDLEKILGHPGMVNVIHNEKGKAQVKGVMPLPKGTTCPPAVNKPTAFWVEPWDDNAYLQLPDGFRKIIAQSDEFLALNGTGKPAVKAPATVGDDDIPF